MNWNHLQTFMAVARRGSLEQAARELGVDATTAGRHVRALEASLQRTLLQQSREGQTLTREGTRLLAQVEKMERAADALEEDDSGGDAASGLVRVSVSEGFGVWFVAPRLTEFSRAHPSVILELNAASGFLNPSRKEADLAILLARPRKGPLIVRRLTDYRLGLYAARDFLGQARPRAIDDIRRLPVIGYIPDFIYAPELDYLEEIAPGLEPRLRSSSINAQHRLIAAGAGVGVLPCFIGDLDPGLVRVLPQVRIERTFWLAVHRDASRAPRVRAFIDWLVNITQKDARVLMGR